MRREINRTPRTSPETTAPPWFELSQIGITTWFETIVANASAATITIDVAEENPPKNASVASPSRPDAKGSVRTKRSGFDPSGSRANPATAIGTTKRLMKNRYAGNAQLAVINWRSSAFSTTKTWNIRGKHKKAAPARNVRVIQRDG